MCDFNIDRQQYMYRHLTIRFKLAKNKRVFQYKREIKISETRSVYRSDLISFTLQVTVLHYKNLRFEEKKLALLKCIFHIGLHNMKKTCDVQN